MDTSKDYYESVMRDFKTYGRGRSLEQYCRDEAIDYKWIEKAKGLYGDQSKGKTTKATKKIKDKSPDMIQLHFEPEPTEITAEETNATPEGHPTVVAEKASAPAWMVASLTIRTPGGHEIHIKTSNPSAVSELLAKLTA